MAEKLHLDSEILKENIIHYFFPLNSFCPHHILPADIQNILIHLYVFPDF